MGQHSRLEVGATVMELPPALPQLVHLGMRFVGGDLCVRRRLASNPAITPRASQRFTGPPSGKSEQRPQPCDLGVDLVIWDELALEE